MIFSFAFKQICYYKNFLHWQNWPEIFVSASHFAMHFLKRLSMLKLMMKLNLNLIWSFILIILDNVIKKPKICEYGVIRVYILRCRSFQISEFMKHVFTTFIGSFMWLNCLILFFRLRLLFVFKDHFNFRVFFMKWFSESVPVDVDGRAAEIRIFFGRSFFTEFWLKFEY